MTAKVPSDRKNASALHLLHRAGQCADELFSSTIGPGHLTPRQYEVLRTVIQSDEPSQTYLVAKTGIDRSTLADIVRRLVNRGLLQRSRTRKDARMYAVRVTQAGELALKDAEPAVHATNEHLLSALPVASREEFLAALEKVIETAKPPIRPPAKRL